MLEEGVDQIIESKKLNSMGYGEIPTTVIKKVKYKLNKMVM